VRGTTLFAAPSWSGAGVSGNWDVIWYYTLVHLRISLLALGLGALVALPLGLVGYRWRASYGPILSVTNALYAIPSLAMFSLLQGPLGILNDKPLIVGLAIYTFAILVRNIVEGLRAVPANVLDAAQAIGYRPARRLVAVELPLAVPAVLAGLRVAAVSTISLVTIGAAIGQGGLGFLMDQGYTNDTIIEVWAGIVATVLLAIGVDAVLVLIGRSLTPWARARASR
jgi:osmoprotectant transport system permease protein